MFMTPGRKLEDCLKRCGYSKADFARMMDVSDQYVQNWLRRGIPAKQSFKAARYLGVNPEWLHFDDRELPPELTGDHPQDQLQRAGAMFDLLSDSQIDLVNRLVLEMIRR